MKKILDYLLSGLFLVYFGLCLVFFHVYQVFAFNVLGKKAHRISVEYFNLCLTYGLYIVGARIRFRFVEHPPLGRPIIFVPNHQSTFDIPPIIWFLRAYKPIFVSKIELARGLPSISYNLRKSGAALIDRKDSKQAIQEITRLGKLIEQTNQSAVIFPEGTRSKTGRLREFSVGGVSALLKKAPRALIVPIAIDGTARMNPQKGLFPLVTFESLTWTVLPGIEPSGKKPEEVVKQAHDAIQEVLDITLNKVAEF